MKYMIDNYNFFEMEPERYFAPPSSWSQEKKQEWAENKIFSGEWYGAQKRDGAFFMFLKDEDGNMYLRPHSSQVKKEFVNKIDWVPHLHSFFNQLDNGTCLLGELYLPSNEQAKTTTSIMNCLLNKAISRQEKESLHYYIFDVLASADELQLERTAAERFDTLHNMSRFFNDPCVEWANYVTGKELWNQIQQLLADGYEGVVITRGDSTYLPGKRTNKDTLKIKKELQETIDCVIMGANSPTKQYTGKEPELWEYWFNEVTSERFTYEEYINQYHITPYAAYAEGVSIVPVTKNWFYGWAGSLKLGLYASNNVLVHVGDLSGLTDEMKDNWRNYLNKVVEISCMEISEDKDGKKGFRHPKFIALRDDKAPEDCTMDQIK